MPDASSAIARLRPARHHHAPRRQSRRFVTRTELHLIVISSVPAGQSTGSRRGRTCAWTLYSRWQWSIATARAERARRRSRPSWL